MTDTTTGYERSDFQSDQEVRWCPGCGDYTILASVQNFMAGIDMIARSTCSSPASGARRASRTT